MDEFVLIAGSSNNKKAQVLTEAIREIGLKSLCFVDEGNKNPQEVFDKLISVNIREPHSVLKKLEPHKFRFSLCIEDSHSALLGWLNQKLDIKSGISFTAGRDILEKFFFHELLGKLKLPQWPTILPLQNSDWEKMDGPIFFKPTFSTGATSLIPQDYKKYDSGFTLLNDLKLNHTLGTVYERNRSESLGNRWIIQKHFDTHKNKKFCMLGVVIKNEIFFETVGSLDFYPSPNETGYMNYFTKDSSANSEVIREMQRQAEIILNHLELENTFFIFEAFYFEGEVFMIDPALRMTSVNSVLAPEYLQECLKGFANQEFNRGVVESVSLKNRFHSFPKFLKPGTLKSLDISNVREDVIMVNFDKDFHGTVVPEGPRSGNFEHYFLYTANSKQEAEKVVKEVCEQIEVEYLEPNTQPHI